MVFLFNKKYIEYLSTTDAGKQCALDTTHKGILITREDDITSLIGRELPPRGDRYVLW